MVRRKTHSYEEKMKLLEKWAGLKEDMTADAAAKKLGVSYHGLLAWAKKYKNYQTRPGAKKALIEPEKKKRKYTKRKTINKDHITLHVPEENTASGVFFFRGTSEDLQNLVKIGG